MAEITTFIATHLLVAWVVLLVCFAVLAKAADFFVDSSVGLAERFKIPKLVIGIVLVSLATTAPELSVSMMAALQGRPEMALGNAIGSVVCNSGLALALCGMVSATAIPIIPHVRRVSGGFLLAVSTLTFGFVAFDGTLNRWEGIVLVLLFFGYLGFLIHQHRLGKFQDDIDLEVLESERFFPLPKLFGIFAGALVGILIASRFIIISATTIAHSLGIPNAVIALTLIALGTSIPEIATSIAAARKREGELAVGNIIGANIMNICWVAGASAVANNLALSFKEVLFMFPVMFIMLIAMLTMMKSGDRVTRKEGFVLFALYVAYLVSFFVVFPPAT